MNINIVDSAAPATAGLLNLDARVLANLPPDLRDQLLDYLHHWGNPEELLAVIATLREAHGPLLFLLDYQARAHYRAGQFEQALDVIERLRESRAHMALVIDAYGGLEGLVTFTDIMRAILGDLPDNQGQREEPVIEREDGTWLVDGMYPVDEFQDYFEIKELPHEDEANYQTVGGMVMTLLGQVPKPSDRVSWAGYDIEVMDMDGRRVDKVLVSPRGEDVE